jgi:preprotein translocase subunit SecF|tara:strand:+ start:216 stop:512 length:297 start_codon:yes stop_codon:yes gene_type:complete
MARRKITTTISADHQKRAIVYGLIYTEALELGIDILGGMNHDIKMLEQDIQQLEAQLSYKKLKINELREEQEKKEILAKNSEFDDAEVFLRVTNRGLK